VQISCDWGASNIAAAKEAEAEQKREDKAAKAKEARAKKEQKAKEKAEKADNKAKETAEKAEKKAKRKAEKTQAAAAASLAADGKSNHGAAAPAPADSERTERSANARELLHSTDPSADLLKGNATEAFESGPSSALVLLHISNWICHRIPLKFEDCFSTAIY
jgi:membrane protein involved in colicin uptake